MASFESWLFIDFLDDRIRKPFVEDLLNFCNETLSKEGEYAQWKKFEDFIDQHLKNSTIQCWEGQDMHVMKPCSVATCFNMLRDISEIRRLGIALSTCLEYVLFRIYLNNLNHVSVNYEWENKRVAAWFSSDNLTSCTVKVFCENSSFMKLLLNFGYACNLLEQSPDVLAETEKFILHFITAITSDLDSVGTQVKKVLRILRDTYFKNQGSCKRLFFTAVALKAIHSKIENKHDIAAEYINCLRMYFIVANDPLLTVFEVRSALYMCFVTQKKVHLFEKYTEEFDILMPESPNILQPRKLIDLARCQVRQNLKSTNLPVPAALENLSLPKRLKIFISGDFVEIRGQTRNITSQQAGTSSDLILPVAP